MMYAKRNLEEKIKAYNRKLGIKDEEKQKKKGTREEGTREKGR